MATPIVVRNSLRSLSLATAAPTIDIKTFNTSITHVTGGRERGREEGGEGVREGGRERGREGERERERGAERERGGLGRHVCTCIYKGEDREEIARYNYRKKRREQTLRRDM